MFALSSCAGWQRIGDLTMISSRNVDSKTEYTELSRHAKSDSKKTIEAALDDAVSKVPGGEFMKNIQVYSKKGKVKVDGDVWGSRPTGYLSAEEKKAKEQQAKLDEKKALADSFKVGDKVTFKAGLTGGYVTAEVTGKDSENAVIEFTDKSGKKKIDKIAFEKLTKVEKYKNSY